MADRPRAKMPVSERAKQFAPFAAIKGLSEALEEKRRVKVARKTLSEDEADMIDRSLRAVKIGRFVSLVYYDDGEYVGIKGCVSKIDSINKTVFIEDTEIMLADVISVSFE